MKTTMNLPDALMEAVKARALSEGRTQTSVVEQAIRMLLTAEPALPTPRAMPTYGNPTGNALKVILEDKEALYAAMLDPFSNEADS